MSDTTELRACPFCGGPVQWGTLDAGNCENVISCDPCDVEVTFFWHGNRAKYAVAWNRRAGEQR